MAKLLIAEDLVPQAESLGMVLRQYGHRALLAGDGTQAENQLRVHGADGIVLDLVMPGTTGRDFLTWLRANPDYLDLPVVISTALPMLDVQDLVAMPQVKVLQKPYTVPELFEAFRAMGLELENIRIKEEAPQ